MSKELGSRYSRDLLELGQSVQNVAGPERTGDTKFFVEQLTPYVRGFPGFFQDTSIVRRVIESLDKPIEIPSWMRGMSDDKWPREYIEKERRIRILRVLELTKLKTRESKVRELIKRKRTEIHLPLIYLKNLSRKDHRELRTWANSISDEELVDALLTEQERLDETMKDQWSGSGKYPPGLAIP